MYSKPIYDTVFTVEHADPNFRYKMKSKPVPINQPIIIEHSATAHLLASDNLQYKNDFGTEFEVSVHSHATLNKS